jgi:hypothetical protein
MQLTGNSGRNKIEKTLHTLRLFIYGFLDFFKKMKLTFSFIFSGKALALLLLIASSM